jgi:hypothetical protein
MPRAADSLGDFDLEAALASAKLVEGNVTRKARGPQPSPFDEMLEKSWQHDQKIVFSVPAAHHTKIEQRMRTAAKRKNMGLHSSDPRTEWVNGEGETVTAPEGEVWLEAKAMPLRGSETPAAE